jgi:hypothetical protein
MSTPNFKKIGIFCFTVEKEPCTALYHRLEMPPLEKTLAFFPVIL